MNSIVENRPSLKLSNGNGFNNIEGFPNVVIGQQSINNNAKTRTNRLVFPIPQIGGFHNGHASFNALEKK